MEEGGEGDEIQLSSVRREGQPVCPCTVAHVLHTNTNKQQVQKNNKFIVINSSLPPLVTPDE